MTKLHDEREAVPAWALIGRDGEPVTLLQKLEQSMEFGSAMEKLAIENNKALAAERERAAEAEHYLAEERKERVATQAFAQGEYLRLEHKIEKAEAELQAERERAKEYKAQADKLEADYLAARAKLQASNRRDALATQAPEV